MLAEAAEQDWPRFVAYVQKQAPGMTEAEICETLAETAGDEP